LQRNDRKVSTFSAISDKKVKNFRNRRIISMLTLLTLSFAISTVPSSIFYTIFKGMIYDKPYRRLVTNSFILLRHLSHAFNFIIYFTSSSIIKQQLTETINEFRRTRKSKLILIVLFLS
jgi:hypothetical protein